MAAAALTTGGTEADFGGGTALTGCNPLAVDPSLAAVKEPPDWLEGPLAELLLDVWNSVRRVGSGPDAYLEASAGVLRNAPGTGRAGVI